MTGIGTSADTSVGFSYSFDCDGDGTFEASGTSSASYSCAYEDDGSFIVRALIADKDGAYKAYSDDVTVSNVAPLIEAITAPTDPVAIADQPVEVTVAFGDPGTGDTHQTLIDWGDGSSDTVSGPSPVAATHSYAEPAVYTLNVTVADDDGGSDSAVYEYVVIYDPDGGFVAGNGRITSEAGWCQLDAACQDAAGDARFGFVSRYDKGATVPSGRTDFVFRDGNFDFESTAYEWLVVNQDGTNAQFRGEGLVNGSLAKTDYYQFMIWAGQGTGEDGQDTFRIRIWYELEDGSEVAVYDNGFDQPISSGRIQVQKN